MEGVDVTSVTVPTNAKGVPGIEKWQQHQAAALKARIYVKVDIHMYGDKQ